MFSTALQSHPDPGRRAAGDRVRYDGMLAAAGVLLLCGGASGAGGVELADLNGTNGLVLNGAATQDLAGHSLSSAGDFNGDGIDDLLISALGASPNGFGSGAVYVVFGTDKGFDAAIALWGLDGSNGFAINGAAAGDFAGISVASAGDINGDGIGDIIIGAYAADPNGASSGSSHVVFGSTNAFPAVVELSELDGSNGFTLNGVSIFERSGRSVACAGDVNGDSIDDLVIGALNAAPHGPASGRAYVVFGSSAGFPAAFELTSLDGTNGFVLNGVAAGDHAGVSVAFAGDVNGDQIDDILVGGSSADPNGPDSGAAYVVFGCRTGFAPVVELSALDGINGFVLNGAAPGDLTAISVASAGDFNGDSFGDLIIGAWQADTNGRNSGAAYLVFGTDIGFGPTMELSQLNGTNGFRLNGPSPGAGAGVSVSHAGDINRDGFDDVVIGAPQASPNGPASGAAYVIFGSAGDFQPVLELSTLNGTDGFAINGRVAGEEAGQSVAAGGDVNGDGIADLLIGAPGAAANGPYSGAGFIVFGSDADCNANGILDILDIACRTSGDFNDNGIPDECEGDLDGDGAIGWADLSILIKAWGACPDPPTTCPADLDSDDCVCVPDLLTLLANWS